MPDESVLAAGRVFYDGFESYSSGSVVPLTPSAGAQWISQGETGAISGPCDVVTSALDGGSGPQAGAKMARCNWNGQDAGALFGHSGTGMRSPDLSGTETFYRFWTRGDSDIDTAVGAKLFRISPDFSTIGGYIFENNPNPGYFMHFVADSADHVGYDINGGWPKTSWRKWEIYIKNASSGGIIHVWINDVLDREWSGNTSRSDGWGTFWVMSNWSLNSGWEHDANNHVYWDEFEIYTSNGSGGTGSMSDGTMTQGAADTTPPAAPTGLAVQ